MEEYFPPKCRQPPAGLQGNMIQTPAPHVFRDTAQLTGLHYSETRYIDMWEEQDQYSQTCLQRKLVIKQKPVFSGKLLHSRGTKLQVPVLKGTCQKRKKQYRTFAVPLQAGFIVFRT